MTSVEPYRGALVHEADAQPNAARRLAVTRSTSTIHPAPSPLPRPGAAWRKGRMLSL